MSTQPTRIEGLSPICRMVQGGFEGSTTDQEDKPLVYKSGPKAGQPRTSYFLAAAAPKTIRDASGTVIHNPEAVAMIRNLHQAAVDGFPHLFNDPNANANPLLQSVYPFLHQLGLQLPKTKEFSFKIVDGDGIDDKGVNNNTKEGFAGCWIFRFSSSSPFKAFWYPDHMTMPLENPGDRIKRGFFIRVSYNASKNDGQTPGVYVNPEHVIGVGYGPIIQGGRDVATAVKGVDMMAGAGAMAAMGMTTTPVDGFSPPPPGATTPPPPGGAAAPQHTTAMPGAPVQTAVVAPPSAPAAAAPPPPSAVAPPPPTVPDPAFVANAGVPAGPVYTMTALANGMSRQMYIDGGWTDDALLSHGYMTVQQ